MTDRTSRRGAGDVPCPGELAGSGVVRYGELRIDSRSRVVKYGPMPVELRRREYALLTHMASDPERVWTRHELLRDVWGFRSDGSTRTVDSHACRVRRKLAAAGAVGGSAPLGASATAWRLDGLGVRIDFQQRPERNLRVQVDLDRLIAL